MNIKGEIRGNASGRSLSITTADESKVDCGKTNRIKSFLRSSPPGAKGSSHDNSDMTQAEVDKQCLGGSTGSSAAMLLTHDRKEQNPGSVSRIMAAQDWDRLRMLLSTEVGQIAVQKQLLSSNDFASESALAFASRFLPPLDVVRCIVDLLPPDVAARPDPMGRSPLHTAAKWGAPPRVIRYLAEMDPAAAATQDVHGRTPLHYAAKSYDFNYAPRRSDDKPHKEAVLEVIRYLCKISPTTVNLEDNEEYTALEYAIENDSDIKVVRSLQKACEKDWKKRRSVGGTKQTHDDIRQKMLVQQQQRRNQIGPDVTTASDVRPLQMQQQVTRAGAEPPKKARKRGSNLFCDTLQLLQQVKRSSSRKSNGGAGDMPVDMDIAEVSKALQALGQEPKQLDDPGTSQVTLGQRVGRKANSTRALVA